MEGEDLLSSAKTTGMGIVELSGIFNSIKPDAVISVADRFETMSTAIASAPQNIPLIHIQKVKLQVQLMKKSGMRLLNYLIYILFQTQLLK